MGFNFRPQFYIISGQTTTTVVILVSVVVAISYVIVAILYDIEDNQDFLGFHHSSSDCHLKLLPLTLLSILCTIVPNPTHQKRNSSLQATLQKNNQFNMASNLNEAIREA